MAILFFFGYTTHYTEAFHGEEMDGSDDIAFTMIMREEVVILMGKEVVCMIAGMPARKRMARRKQ